MSRHTLEFSGMLTGVFLLAMAVKLFFKPAAIFAGGIPGLAIIVMNFSSAKIPALC